MDVCFVCCCRWERLGHLSGRAERSVLTQKDLGTLKLPHIKRAGVDCTALAPGPFRAVARMPGFSWLWAVGRLLRSASTSSLVASNSGLEPGTMTCSFSCPAKFRDRDSLLRADFPFAIPIQQVRHRLRPRCLFFSPSTMARGKVKAGGWQP